MKLGDISLIKMGLVLTRKKAENKYGVKKEYEVISIKNIELDGTFNAEPLDVFYSNEILDEQYFTKEGDILIRVSSPNTVVYIDSSKAGLLIPSYFAVITIINKDYLSKYVAWYLNTKEIKQQIKKTQSGGVTLAININTIQNLEIKHISTAKQEIVIDVEQLYRKEKKLMFNLIEEKEKLYNIVNEKIISLED
ncbi:MAG: restriction endonuclease subunit S [Bacilli bacterium]|nr:restriction endonuclease subunit S [Bacilli bacterium]